MDLIRSRLCIDLETASGVMFELQLTWVPDDDPARQKSPPSECLVAMIAIGNDKVALLVSNDEWRKVLQRN